MANNHNPIAGIEASDTVHLKPSGIHGLGIFTRRPVAPGEPLYRIRGEKICLEYDDDFASGPNWVSVGWQEWVAPEPDNPLTFTNHACEPNAIISENLTVVALRAIPAENEIFLDYSTTELDPLWQMPCDCQSPRCRKQIVSFQKLPASLQLSYQPYLSEEFRRAVRKSSAA